MLSKPRKSEVNTVEEIAVYPVLPADRIKSIGRWLCILVQRAKVVNARSIETKPEKLIVFLNAQETCFITTSGTVTARLLKNMSVFRIVATLTLAPFPGSAFANAAQECNSPTVINTSDTIIPPTEKVVAVEDNKRPCLAPATDVLPYGVQTLEDTDPEKLKASLLKQITDAGLPKPDVMELYPAKGWKDPTGYAERNSNGYTNKRGIVGNTDRNFSQDILSSLNDGFPNQPKCGSHAFVTGDNAYNTYDALHETTHYIAYNMVDANGADLNWYLFSAVNAISPPQKPYDYASALRTQWGHSKDMNTFIKLTVAKNTYIQLYERLADAGAVLYSLSNYNDTAAIKAYYNGIVNLTDAMSFSDRVHDTSSSINAVVDTFDKSPRKGLSIVETTQWAAQIIKNQPEFNQSLYDIAGDYLKQQTADNNIYFHPEDPYISIAQMLASVKDNIREKISARNAFCGVAEVLQP